MFLGTQGSFLTDYWFVGNFVLQYILIYGENTKDQGLGKWVGLANLFSCTVSQHSGMILDKILSSREMLGGQIFLFFVCLLTEQNRNKSQEISHFQKI